MRLAPDSHAPPNSPAAARPARGFYAACPEAQHRNTPCGTPFYAGAWRRLASPKTQSAQVQCPRSGVPTRRRRVERQSRRCTSRPGVVCRCFNQDFLLENNTMQTQQTERPAPKMSCCRRDAPRVPAGVAWPRRPRSPPAARGSRTAKCARQ